MGFVLLRNIVALLFLISNFSVAFARTTLSPPSLARQVRLIASVNNSDPGLTPINAQISHQNASAEAPPMAISNDYAQFDPTPEMTKPKAQVIQH